MISDGAIIHFITLAKIIEVRLIINCLVIIHAALWTNVAQGQVRITGEITHNGRFIGDAYVKVIENEKVVDVIQTARRGKYELELPFDKEVILHFGAPYMYDVAIEVSTELSHADENEVTYEVPLNMTLFYRFQDLPSIHENMVIGKVMHTGKGVESFSFTPNAQALEQIKPIREASEKRFLSGEHPASVESEVESRAQTVPTTTEAKTEIAKPVNTAPHGKKSELQHQGTSGDKFANQSKRFEVIEKSNQLQAEASREAVRGQTNSQTMVDIARRDHDHQSKQLRSEIMTQQAAKDKLLADARVDKYEKQPIVNGKPNINNSKHTTTPKLLKHTMESGYFVSEERMLLEWNGHREEYRKTIYDWMVVEFEYFYKNEIEISEHEYEAVRRMVRL